LPTIAIDQASTQSQACFFLIVFKCNPSGGEVFMAEQVKTKLGNGGELHQQVAERMAHKNAETHLTTNQGIRVSDNQNSLTSGMRGPALLEDFVLREKIFHFDHERIPERIVHARGSGAHGYFELYKSLSRITKADLFQRAGEKTPVFARFSTVAGGAGSVDTPRDVRGFAVKFYTFPCSSSRTPSNFPILSTP
jgi:catalase